MTTVTILNDGLSGVEKNPKELIAAINDAACGGRKGYLDRSDGVRTYHVGNCGNNVQIPPSFHADDIKVFVIGQNLMSDLTKIHGIESKRDIEFQLDQIKLARSIIDYSEKELRKKLK